MEQTVSIKVKLLAGQQPDFDTLTNRFTEVCNYISSLFTLWLASGVHVTTGEWIAMIVTILVGSLLIGIVEESG